MENGNDVARPDLAPPDEAVQREVENFLRDGEMTIVDAPITVSTEPPSKEELVRDEFKYDRIVNTKGQLACKRSSIAGGKAGGCERLAVEVCHSCQLPFCPDHASTIDINFCADCLSPEATEVIREPLASTDGVIHHGIHITIPQSASAYKSLSRQIVDMTDSELYEFIKEESVKIRQAEAVKEYHMIAKSSACVEQDFREKEATRKLRGIKYNVKAIAGIGTAEGGRIANGGAAAKPKGIDALKGIMEKMGMQVTTENIVKFAAFLASKKGS